MDSIHELKRFMDILEEVSLENGKPLCITILDSVGLPVLLSRMSGAGILNIEMADRKAYTSAVTGAESGALMSFVQPGAPGYTLTSSSSRLIAFGGGTRVQFENEIFGIGISGGKNDMEDMDMLATAQKRFGITDAIWSDKDWRTTK
jgi:uncharacterized protein GlcG (DUF336 family)